MTDSKIKKNVRGLGLTSGGLDSILAALVLRRQGIDVSWVCFETPFFTAEKAVEAARVYDIPLIKKDITDLYIEMLKNPPGGYGKHMNPCRDCHALMFRLAGGIMASEGFDFLFSGEVAGQRPMSQTKPSLRYVEKRSGFDGYILRPLSAKCLPVTPVEEQGIVDRERLLDFSGRSRKPQIKLAEDFGVTDYPSPAGGCLLTDSKYSTRLRDLYSVKAFPRIRDYHLLKHGRHLRFDETVKAVIGRTKADNDNIMNLADPDTDIVVRVKGFPGPACLMPDGGNDSGIRLAASICAGYSKAPNDRTADVKVVTPDREYEIQVMPVDPKAVRELHI